MAVEQTAIAFNAVASTPVVSVGGGDRQRIAISMYLSSSASGYVSLMSGDNFVVRDLAIAPGVPSVFTGKILINPGDDLGIRGLDAVTPSVIWDEMTGEQWSAMTEEQWSTMGVAGIPLNIYVVHSDI